MGKVVTNAGVENIPNHKPKGNGEAPPLEVKKDAPLLDVGAPGKSADESPAAKVTEPPAAAQTDDEGLDAEDLTFPEKVRRRIAAKHRAMREAQEDAAANERLAESQYNERRLLEQRTAAQEERIRELEGKVATPAPVEELKAPDIKAFTNEQGQVDWDKYTDAKADYAAEKAVRAERARQAQERAEGERTQHEARLKATADAARKAHPDFDQVMRTVANTEADKVPQFVLNFLFESEHSAEVAYYLAKNPEESRRIAQLKPTRAYAELAKLEDSLVKPQSTQGAATSAVTPARPGAPPPITPLSGAGNGAVNTDPSKMDFKQLRAYHRAQAREKH